MSYLHDAACAGGGAPCGCRRRDQGLGERYLPEVLDGLGVAPVVQPGTPAARRLRARQAAVKGKIAERLMSGSPAARLAMGEAKIRASQEGIDPATVKFTRNVKGVHNDGVDRQLTDGVIYGRTRDGKVRILNVFESKARSGLRDVAVRERGDLGQLARDFERLRQLPLKIDNQYVQPSQVQVSRRQTAWTVYSPKGVKPTDAEAREISRAAGFNFRHVELPFTNAQLEARAARFVQKHPVRR